MDTNTKYYPTSSISSGSETVLDIVLEESVTLMDAIVVRDDKDKSTIDNEMALTSARAFTVEETKRYAGSFNDPALWFPAMR